MMTDTPETLQSALADLTRRVAAFEQAQKQADVEPPKVPDDKLTAMHKGYGFCLMDCEIAVNRLRYVEAELARLREGLKVQEGDVDQPWLDLWTDKVPGYDSCFVAAAREIQRHRALVTKDGHCE